MGTKNTRIEKMEYVSKILLKSEEGKKGFSRKYIVSNLMIYYFCTKKTADEIVQAFIDGRKADVKIEDGEEVLYG